MMKRVTYLTDLALTTADLREDKLGAGVVITTWDGRRLKKEVPAARGSSENPMDLRQKFLLCSRGVIGEEMSIRALEILSALEEVEDVGKLAVCFLKGQAGSEVPI